LSTIQIAGRLIGAGHPTYVIAEISGNHNGSFERAVELVKAAKRAGADAVKLQTYTADTITLRSDKEHFRVSSGTLWDGRTLYELYQEAHTPWEWQPRLKALADELGLHCFSSPFDPTAVDFLEAMQVPAHKVASFELVDIPLVRRLARTGKPLIVSTGMATLAEIDEAVTAARDEGATELALLKTNSAYPAPPSEMNLRTIAHLEAAFGVPAGLSDHTLGIAVPIVAVGLGARIVEKHLTLRRSDGGPDASFSLEPEEFQAMVEGVRVAEQALGEVHYAPTKAQLASRVFRRSLFAVADVEPGELLTHTNVRSIRPANGLHPRHLPDVVGRRARCRIERGTPLSWELIE
jgi:pseudaminic acid synthase